MSRDMHSENDQEHSSAAVEATSEQLDSVDQHEPIESVVQEDADSESRIAILEQELADAKDQALRAVADAQNARRRAEQDAEKARKFALERFVKELLPVVDGLEKALDSMREDEAASVHLEGVEMTLKMQLATLERFGVQMIDPQGAPFDPQYHEAMTVVPNPALEPNTVMDVLQKGFTLNERLVRPAMVVVSKGADA